MSNKKKIIIIVVAALLVAAITTTVLVVFKPFNKPVEVVSVDSANKLKKDAIEAMKSSDNATAKDLLVKAQQQYKEVGDQTNEIDTAAQLWILEHPITPPAQ